MYRSKFIITAHYAERAGFHYDIRFRIPKSKLWDSFATKEDIPLEPGKRILVIRTEKHREKEAIFVGRIEAGYGKGIIEKFDDGECDILKYSQNIIINFRGEKIKGVYHFINISTNKNKKDIYLFFKTKT